RVQPGVSVRVTRVPAGDGGILVKRVRHVPAEDDVAEPEPLGQGGLELLEGNVLPPQHAIDVEAAYLGPTDPVPPQALDDTGHSRITPLRQLAPRRALPRRAL